MSTGEAAPLRPGSDPGRSRGARISQTMPLMAVSYGVGLGLAAWDPRPAFIVTVVVGICVGMLLLGPYAAAAISGLRLHRLVGGHLRWPLCLILAGGAVLLLAHVLPMTRPQLLTAITVAMGGTIMGHDASLAVLHLRSRGRLDAAMVVLFPALLGTACVAGYSSFGFAVGIWRFGLALLGGA